MNFTTVKTEEAIKLLNLKSRQSLHYYVKKGWLKPVSKKSFHQSEYKTNDVLKLKDYLDGPDL